MPHMTLTLNGQALLDDKYDEWQQRAPEALLEYLKPGAAAQPWVKPAMMLLSDFALANQAIEIHVTTDGVAGHIRWCSFA